jgi:hypothetical protein
LDGSEERDLLQEEKRPTTEEGVPAAPSAWLFWMAAKKRDLLQEEKRHTTEGTGSAVSLAFLDGSEDLGGDVVDLVQHVLVCHLFCKRDLSQEEKRLAIEANETYI